MKNKFGILMFGGFLAFASCSTDNEEVIVETVDLQTNVHVTNQKANPQFDETQKGLYRSVFANLSAIGGGALDINLSNNGSYSASLELTDGTILDYNLVTDENLAAEKGIYQFEAPNSVFTIDVTNPDAPVITNAYLNGDSYGTFATKETSQRAQVIIVGTYVSPSGPQNLQGNFVISADDVTNAVTNVMTTTINGDFPAMDNVFEDYLNCNTMQNTTPSYLDQGQFIILDLGLQNSNFNNGNGFSTEWDLRYFRNAMDTPQYANSTTCLTNQTSGTFTWTDANESYDGEIYINFVF